MRLVPTAAVYRVALHAALVTLPLVAPPLSARAADLLAPPAWVTTDNGVMLKRQSDENTKLPANSKVAKRAFDQGLELATKGADEETQKLDDSTLARAEDKFTLLVDELAPNYAYAYTNRANVRIARSNFVGAIEDYGRALELAPLATDAWVTYLNRGSTLLRIDRPREALRDLSYAIEASNGDRYALLGRGSAYHTLGQFDLAVSDFSAVLEKYPGDIQPWWVRHALDLSGGPPPRGLGHRTPPRRQVRH